MAPASGEKQEVERKKASPCEEGCQVEWAARQEAVSQCSGCRLQAAGRRQQEAGETGSQRGSSQQGSEAGLDICPLLLGHLFFKKLSGSDFSP